MPPEDPPTTGGSDPRAIRILLVSCYELGQQPLGIAWPAGFLKRAGFRPHALDLAVDDAPPPEFWRDRGWDLIAIATPMHTALRLGMRLLGTIRESGAGAHICFHGLYAELFRDELRSSGVHSVLSGESEQDLVRLATALSEGRAAPLAEIAETPRLERLNFPPPDRSSLRPMRDYLRLSDAPGNPTERLVASIESTRGCRHLCRHCPIPPVYGGRFFVVPKDTVLDDIDQMVDEGAAHVHFVDPDFLNGPKHALQICEAMHRRHPNLSFDFTAKVEHLLGRRDTLARLGELGCLFVTTAVESLSDEVLARLDKGHRREDLDRLVELLRSLEIAMKPTWVAFTPWTTRTDYVEMLSWIAKNELVDDSDLVQLTIRLLVPGGSLLMQDPTFQGTVKGDGATTREEPFTLSVDWRHPDRAMDELQSELSRRVEGFGRHDAMSHRGAFEEICRIASERLGILTAPVVTSAPSARPRLTENWFC